MYGRTLFTPEPTQTDLHGSVNVTGELFSFHSAVSSIKLFLCIFGSSYVAGIIRIKSAILSFATTIYHEPRDNNNSDRYA